MTHTCRYTPGTPCLACEAERTRMHRQQQLLGLARPFIRAQIDSGFIPKDAQVEGEVLLLVGAAVEYGRRQERLRGIPLAAQADGTGDARGWQVTEGGCIYSSAVSAYNSLWDSINKKRGFGWETNPWVWALTFERVEAMNNGNLYPHL